MCPTSNIQTKTVENFSEYPLYDFYKGGIKVGINTDNRTVSDVDLSHEVKLIFDEYNMSEEEYKDIYLSTVDSIFADEYIKRWLIRLIYESNIL